MIVFGDIPMGSSLMGTVGTPNTRGVGNICDFQPITRCITKTVGLQDGHLVTMEGNRKPYAIS